MVRESIERRLAVSIPGSGLVNSRIMLPGDGSRFPEVKLITLRQGVRLRQPIRSLVRDIDVLPLLNANLPSEDVVIDLFTPSPDSALGDFQCSFIEALIGSAATWSSAGRAISEDLPDLLRLAASATPAGHLLRALFRDPGRRSPKNQELRPAHLPGLPGISERLIVKASDLAQRRCLSALGESIKRWNRDLMAAMPTYIPATITIIDPSDACEGDVVTITGQGFDSATNHALVMTGPPGEVVVVAPEEIVEWSSSQIRLTLPQGVGLGPVGIVEFPTSSERQAVEDLLATASSCFGPAAIAAMERRLSLLVPTITVPALQNDSANLFVGGVPSIDHFEITPTVLRPGQRFTIRWRVTGASRIEIEQNSLSQPAVDAPTPVSPLPPHGEVTLEAAGQQSWRSRYVLRAFNKCATKAPVERAIDVELSTRRGLALGGGGTRGDFQVGALAYLYRVKGFRPDAIASTSVGSINALELAQGGDDALTRLEASWLKLGDEADMWGNQTWLTKVSSSVRRIIRSLSVEGLLAAPYAVFTVADSLGSILDSLRNATSFFNIDPIEKRMRESVDPGRVANSGIELRMISVSLETGDVVTVDQNGAVKSLSQPALGSLVTAPKSDIFDGAVASASMPGIFPARQLDNHMCVDGGVREVVPLGNALNDLGCTEVYAIRNSAPPPVLSTNPDRLLPGVISRAVLEITYDEIANDDLSFGGCLHGNSGSEVRIISPTINLHDPLVVEPGLIRIAMDYGWMRAADVIELAGDDRQSYAIELSDRITLLRAENWRHAHWAASNVVFRDPHRGAAELLLGGVIPKRPPETRTIRTPEAVQAIRKNCIIIRQLLQQRIVIGAPIPAVDVVNEWFRSWEMTREAPVSSSPWSVFDSAIGSLPAVDPPPVF